MDQAIFNAIHHNDVDLLCYHLVSLIGLDQLTNHPDITDVNYIKLEFYSEFDLISCLKEDADVSIPSDLMYEDLEVELEGQWYDNHPNYDDDLELTEMEMIESHIDSRCQDCQMSYQKSMNKLERIAEQTMSEFAYDIAIRAEMILSDVKNYYSSVNVGIESGNNSIILFEINSNNLSALTELSIVQDKMELLPDYIIDKLPISLQLKIINVEIDEVSIKLKLLSDSVDFLLKHTNARSDKLELYFAKLVNPHVIDNDLCKLTMNNSQFNKSTISKYRREMKEIISDFGELCT